MPRQYPGEALLNSPLARRLLWSLIPAAIAIGGIWGVVFGDEGLLQRHALKQRLSVMQDRVTAIQTENEDLRLKIQRLREDPVALRRAAAEQLLAAEPGSTIYRFTDTATTP